MAYSIKCVCIIQSPYGQIEQLLYVGFDCPIRCTRSMTMFVCHLSAESLAAASIPRKLSAHYSIFVLFAEERKSINLVRLELHKFPCGETSYRVYGHHHMVSVAQVPQLAAA